MKTGLLKLTILGLLAGCASLPTERFAEGPFASRLVLAAASHGLGGAAPATAESPAAALSCLSHRPDSADFQQILRQMFEEAVRQKAGDGAELPDAADAFHGLTDEAIVAKTGLTREQIRQAAQLLASGRFRRDLADVVRVAVKLVPNLLEALPATAERVRKDLVDMASRDHVKAFKSCLPATRNGVLCQHLPDLFSDPTTKVFRGTLSALLENESVRLALIAYAHANGVDIRYEDLDFVKDQLDRPAFDLDQLAQAGKLRLEKKYKLDEAKAKLAALTASCRK